MKHQLECSMYIMVISTHTHLETTKHFDAVQKNPFEHKERQEPTPTLTN